MYTTVLIVFLIVATSLISIILLQQGKGSIMGASFSSGASSTLFGSYGANNFVTLRMIPLLSILFFLLSLIIGNLNSHKTSREKVQELHRVDVPSVHVPNNVRS
ncbi:preprotein translocase subunit SecG [Candidatus Erwinia haradaeae]|uniref:Protein-export membrane protein SecG n=1 Tax=Candidatus Erwinia haradaeae TaxID=1922217 RepID=A0A451DAA8_9GAMM|nr:preprotein translocase subunit SecG [Candidatus Erwinia haradaeae]VFP83280.1 Protein-export membrane protein SecG [Candidatus Erwinia haradaeae]